MMKFLPTRVPARDLAASMRITYLDCSSGISGDMFLGALLDAGVPFALFEKTVADLNIGATLEISRVDRGGISATKLDVVVGGEKDMPREEYWKAVASEEAEDRGQGLGDSRQTARPHSHFHPHGETARHSHTEIHEPPHSQDDAHSHGHGRHLRPPPCAAHGLISRTWMKWASPPITR